MVIPGIYCLVNGVFLDVKEPPSMPRIPHFLILTLTALFLSITLPPQARAQQPDDVVWVQIQAVQSLATATDRAQAYTALLEDVNGFALGGGWYGIVVGPYTRADAELVLQTYRRDGLIPRDSFLQSTPRLGQQFWPVGANVLNRGVIEAPETIETPPPAAPETPTPQAPEVAEVVPEPEPEPVDETPAEARRSEVLTFNSGGSGARPEHDGLNATAFPSGVMTMPIEATEHAGPVIIWRKELRPDSGGAGKQRGGLGQYMEVGAREGHEFDIQAMFDRVNHPARGRRGGGPGAATTIAQDDGTKMNGKGKQFVPHGRKVMMAFPGGAGYGDPKERPADQVKRDLARGYISAQTASDVYGLDASEIKAVQTAVTKGEAI